MVFYLPSNQNQQAALAGNLPDVVYIPYNAGRRVGSRSTNAAGDFKAQPPAQTIELVSYINTKINEGVINVSASVNVDGTTIDGLGTAPSPYKVANAGIDTTQLADDAVTFAKIQNLSIEDTILGRETAGAGAVEEIALGTGLAFNAGSLDVTGDGKTLISAGRS